MGKKYSGIKISTEALESPRTIQYNGSSLGEDYLPSGFTPDQGDLEDYLSNKQSTAAMITNAVGKVIPNTLLQTVETLSYLVDFKQIGNQLQGEETEYTNWLAEAMKSAKQSVDKATPVYRTDEAQTGFAPGDASWWFNQTPDTVSSMLSLLAPALITGGVASAGLRAVGLGARGTMTAEAALAAEQRLSTLANIPATAISRHAESTMEAGNLYKDTYSQALQQGMSDQEAKQKAGLAASRTYNRNWIFALQDFLALNTLTKGFNASTKGVKGASLLDGAKTFASVGASEGLEEAGQFVVSEEGKRAALEDVDYFGSGFSVRLQDYMEDPEFKASVLQGALGGVLMQGSSVAGSKEFKQNVEDKFNKLTGSAIRKEKANKEGNIGNSLKEDQKIFTESISDHLAKGTLGNYKQQLEEVAKSDKADPETKQSLKNMAEDVDFIISQQDKIKANKAIPQNLHNTFLATQLAQRTEARIADKLQSSLQENYQQLVKTKELDATYLPLKEAQVRMNAYSELVKTQPQFKPQLELATKLYNNQLSALNLDLMKQVEPGFDINNKLVTSQDNDLNRTAFQLASTGEKLKQIKEDIVKYSTKGGIESIKKEEQAKQEIKVAQSTASKPDVTEKEITNLLDLLLGTEQLGKVTSVEAKQVLESKLAEIKQANVQKNIEEVQTKVEEETTKTTKKPTTQAELDLLQKGFKAAKEDNQPVNITPPTNTVNNIEQETTELKPITTKVEQETFTAPVVTSIPVQTVNLKPEEGNLQTWNRALKTELDENNKTKFDKQGKAIYVRDVDGYTEEGEFYLNGKKQKASQVLQTDGSGNLLLDTPLVKIGDTVILKIENNGFKSNPNFVPKQVGIDDIINVYLANKDGNQVGDRPISQLTSADNTALNKKQEKFNKDLRKQILDNGGTLTTTIVHKTIGDTKTGNKANPIAVLESDYYNDQFTKLPFNPLLLISGQIPNLDYKVYPESYVQLVNQAVDLTKTRPEESMGGIAISRMSADGTHRLEYLENRNLSEQEISYILTQLASFKDFKPETLRSLKDVVLITPKGGGSLSLDKNIPLLSEKLPGLGVITGDNKLLVKVSADEVFTISNFAFKNLMSGKNGVDIKTYKLVDGKGVSEKITLTEDQYQTYKDHITKNLQKSFRNVSKVKVNTLDNYTDPVTKQVYKDYWDFLNQTRTLTTRLRGSLTGGSGIESSYSSQNAQIYLDPYPNSQTKVEVKEEEIQVVSQPPLAPTSTSPVGTKKADTIKERFAKRRQGKNKPALGYNFKVTGEKELQWFKDNYGEEFLEVVANVDRFIGANGVEAFGMYYNVLVTLAQESPTGTVFHEAGHFVLDVENGLITQARKDKILKEASKVYNLKDESKLEEKLMEDYEKYRASNGTYVPKVKATEGFFAKLLNLFKKLFGFKSEIEKLYKFIDSPNITVEQRKKLLERRNSLGSGEVMFKKAPGFFTFKEQKDAIDSFKYKVMQAIYATGDKISNLETYITDKNKLAKLLNQVKSQFVTDASQLLNKADITEAEEDRLVVLLNTGIISKEQVAATIPDFVDFVGEWEDYSVAGFKQDGFKTKVIQSFADFGFVIKGEDITQEQQNEKIHDIPQEVINPSDSLSFRSKLFLSSIPQPIIDENNQVIDTEKTILGVDKVIDVKAVDAMLSFKLADSINPYARLQDLAKVHPIAQIVFNKLNEVRDKGDTQTFQEVLMKYSRNTMDKKTVLHEERIVSLSTPEVDEKGNKVYRTKKFTTKFIDTNRNSVFRTLIRDWNAEAVHIKFISFTDQLLDKSKSVLKQFSDLQEKRSKLPKNQDVPFDELLITFKDILAGMGITLPVEVWKEFSSLPEDINDPKKFTLQKKNELITKRYNNLKGYIFGSKAATLQDLLDKVKEGVNPFKEETGTVLERLARLSAIYMTNIKTGAYLNEKGDLEYPINLPSYITDFNNLVGNKELLSNYLANSYKDQFNQGNEFLQVLDETTKSNPLHEGKIKLTFLSSFRESNRDAKDFGQRTEIESIFSRFAAFGNSALNSTYGWISIGTLADKAKNAFFQLPKYKGAKAKELFKRVLNNTVNQELARIQDIREYKGYRERFNNLKSRLETLTTEEKAEYDSLTWLKETTLPNDVANLKNQDKFIYIPELNAIPNLTSSITKGEISVTEFNEAQAQKDKVIDDFIQTQYEAFLRYLQNNDLIRVTRNAKTGNLTIINNKDGIPNDLISTNPNPTATEINSFLEEFFFNDTAWRLEMSKVFMGDAALYKSVDNSITDDYFKRAYQLVTPGYKPFLTTPETVTRASYASQMTGLNPEEVKALTDIGALPETVAAYGTTEDPDTNATDAQSYTSTHGYRKLAMNTGAWSKDVHEKLYQFAWKDNLSVNQAIQNKGLNKEEAKEYRTLLNNTVLPSLKPFQFSEIELALPNGRVRRIKVQYKDSISVVTPEMGTTKQGYKQLLDFFQANPQIDILSAEDTVKVGKFGVISDLTKPIEKWQTVTTSLSDIKFPQMIGEDVKDKTSGSQFHKLVVGDIIDDGDYVVRNKTVKGKKIKEAWNNLWVEKIQGSRQELADLLGLGTDFTLSEDPVKREQQLQKIKLVLENEVAQRGLNENYRDGLQLTKDEQNAVDFMIPLSFPQLGEKYQGILTNLFKKYIVKQKSPGFVGVNLADFGVDRSDKLGFITGKDKKVVAAEIGLSIDYFKDIGLEYGTHIDRITKKVIWEELNETQKQALEFIAFRIPTSNKSSMLPVRVAYILPGTYGNTVMIPAQSTKQMGLDFDIDKSQLLRRVLTEKDYKKNELSKIDKDNVDTKLFDLYWSILTSPLHINDVIDPLNTDFFESLSKEFKERGIVSVDKSAPFYSVMQDAAVETKNREEKAKVGQAALASTAHALLQMIKPYIAVNVRFGLNGGKTNLGELIDSTGRKISKNLGEIQQAALDAAKTPLLSLFGITKNLMPLANTQALFGYDLRTIASFYSHPVVKEWSRLFIQNDSNEKLTRQAFESEPKYLTLVKNAKEHFNKKDYSISASELDQSLSTVVDGKKVASKIGDNPTLDAKIYAELTYLYAVSKDVTPLINALSIDTKDDATSIEMLLSYKQQIKDITTQKEGKFIVVDPRVFDLSVAPVETKRLAAYVEYFLNDALKLAGQFYPTTNDNYTEVRNHIINTLGIRETDQELMKSIDQFMNFYSLNHDYKLKTELEAAHPLASQGLAYPGNNKAFRWSFLDPDNSFLHYVDKLINKYPFLEKDAFVNALRNTAIKSDTLPLAGIKNTNDLEKSEQVQAWSDLFNEQNIELQTLAHDAVRYAIMTSGFTYHNSSFADLIPLEYWSKTNLKEVWNTSSRNVNKDSALLNFVRHKYKTIKYFPSIKVNEDGNSNQMLKGSKKFKDNVLQEFAVNSEVNRTPRFVIVEDNLYEAEQQNTDRDVKYKLLQPLGSKFFYEAAGDGRQRSNHPDNQIGSPNPFEDQLKTAPKGMVEKQTEVKEQSSATFFTNHSGGAEGADIQWDIIGREFGKVNNNHYWMNKKTPHGNKEITKADEVEGQQKVTIAARQMGRIEPTHQVRQELLIRNWSQVKYADAVFAITTIQKEGDEMNYGKKAKIVQGKGGTGYAIQMAINEGKPVYVFDQVRKQWVKNINGVWSQSEVPVLTPNFAGIGTREINEAGKQAIRDVYEKTFPKPTQQGSEVVFPLLSNVSLEQNDFVADYLPEKQNDPKTVLEKLIGEETDEETKAVLENMLRNVDKLKTTIDLEVLDGKAGLFKIREGNNGIETSISINPNANMNKASDQRRVIIHELDHAYMVSVLQNPSTELEINFNRNVERLAQEAKTRLGNIQGTENKFEFVAELASNPEFRSKLRNKPDLWSRMLRFVRKLFGMRDSYDQLLDQRYQVIDQIEDLQKLTPDEFALKQPKKPKPMVKKLTVLSQIVENLKAKYRRYEGRNKADLAKKTFKDIGKYEELQKEDRGKFVLKFLTDTANQLKVIGETLPKLEKADAENINAPALVGIKEELASFEILEHLQTDVRKNGSEYFKDEKETPDAKVFNELLGLTRQYKTVVRELERKRAAWFTKQSLPNSRVTEAEMEELLELNDRGDITAINSWLDPNSQTTDPALQAAHRAIKDALASSDRRKFDLLNNDEQQQRKVTYDGVTISYKPTSVYKASEDFDKWVGRKTTLREKYSVILDAESFKQGSEGIRLISPTSAKGKEILSIKPTDKNFALRQFYETFVLQYLHSQTDTPKYLRPGVRIPSIPKSLFEGFTQNEGFGKLTAFSDSLKQQFIAKYDENERKLLNEEGQVDLAIPVRFVAKQDGEGNHLKKEEVSLDLATTLTLAIEEALQRAELTKIEPDLQLIKSALADRKVAVMKKNSGWFGLLTREQEPEILDSGAINTIDGIGSNAYKSMESMMNRFVYGKMKNDEGTFNLFGKKLDVRSTTDAVLKATGFKMLFGNFAVSATNLVMGEMAAIREAVGGKLINLTEWSTAKAKYFKEGLPNLRDLTQKQKQTKFGKFIEFINPGDRKDATKYLGVDDTTAKTLWTNFAKHSFIESNLVGTTTFAVAERFKVLDKDGKEVSFYEGGEFNKNNRFVLKEGHTYKGRKEFIEEDFNEFKNYALALYQEMNGIYNQLDSSAIKASSVGAAVLFMRNWFRSGLRSRWQLKRESVELNQDVEGYYISALVGFTNLFSKEGGWLTKTAQGLQMLWIAGKANPDLLLLPNELGLSQEQKDELVAMRQSNIRKSMFDLYSVALISLAVFLAFSGDEDEDNYTKMMLVRMRRELMTFYSPSTAWEVLKSPTVALKTITDIQSVIWRTVYSPFEVLQDGELEKYEKGKWKDWPKLYADWAKVTGLGQFKQFEDIGTTTRLLGSGVR